MEKFKKRSKKGYVPGAPIYVGDTKAQKTKITVTDYNKDSIEIHEFTNPEDCRPFKSSATNTWVNISGLLDIDSVAKIGEIFGLHPLIVEDILDTEHRPKLDIFDDYLFITFKLYSYNKETRALTEEQLSLVLGENHVVTFQEKGSDLFSSIHKRLENPQSNMRKFGADYLVHALLDITVDSYFEVLEKIGDVVEDIESRIINKPSVDTLKEIHEVKREMIRLRKSIWPLREIISGLHRRISPLIQEQTLVYLKDIYDHTIQVMDTVETYRDILSGMLDLYMSTMSNKMNDVMKILTIFATIFIPLTFITGLYGMNFNPKISPFNMPELGWYFGYPFALAIMAAVAIGMLILFKRKKWF